MHIEKSAIEYGVRFLRRFVAAAMVLGAIGVVGCDKKVQLTFTNLSDSSRELYLDTPNAVDIPLGTLGANGGRLRHDLKIKKNLLPAMIAWRAGNVTGRMRITKKTPKKVWIDIKGSGSRARGKHEEIEERRHIEIKDQPIHQETVVE